MKTVRNHDEGTPERLARIRRERETWVRRLRDESRRNPLLYYRPLKRGTLELDGASPETVADLLRGEGVPLRRLFPAPQEVQAAANLEAIRRQALTNEEEKGLETLFLAIGMATWRGRDDGRAPQAPVLLLPLTVESRGRENRNLVLRRAPDGDVHVNDHLVHALSGLGCELDPEALPLDVVERLPGAVFDAIERAAQGVDGFEIARGQAVIANFSFQRLAMIRDLENEAALAGHDLIAALVGDPEARRATLSGGPPPEPRGLDRIPPDSEFLVLDADSSQQCVIEAVRAGRSGVIHGPPGTGKSQTIANLIATLAAEGKSILFVAEKRAALEVVKRRLDQLGLGHLILDFHKADVSRRDVAKGLRVALEHVHTVLAPPVAEIHREFSRRRDRLVDHVRALHTKRPPSGRSIFELKSQLLQAAPVAARTSIRWRGGALEPLDPARVARIRELLVEAGGHAGLFLGSDPSPWTNAPLLTGDDVERALDTVARLLHERLPRLEAEARRACEESGLPIPDSVAAVAGQTLKLLRVVVGHFAEYTPDVYEADLDEMLEDLAPAERGRVSSWFALLTSARFRAARRRARALCRNPRRSVVQIVADLWKIVGFLELWRRHAGEGATPRKAQALEDLRTAHAEVLQDLHVLEKAIDAAGLVERPFDDLRAVLTQLEDEASTARRLPRIREIERELDRAACGSLVAELRKGGRPPDIWPEMLDHAWLSSCLEHALKGESDLAAFNGRTHDKTVAEFVALDRQRIRVAVERVRRAHAERVVQAMEAYPEEAALVRRESEKATRHLPLRKLLAQAPNVLPALCPCWMASPLSVSQLLPADRRYFEYVLFDEASQVLPEDAVPAILRGRKVVVAGDRRQLPPTTFFVGGDDEEDEEGEDGPGATAGFESLLDQMTAFLTPWPLSWHYRSRDERLVAFSNHHIYGGSLITLPGSGRAAPVAHVPVSQEPGRDEDTDSVSAEVRRVVELVLEHAEREPGQSLGVIAMGLKHARRIEAELDRVLRDRPDLAPFFDTGADERFFVKNLERVQGDERDAIILSIGYGKDRAGRLPFRFGPLLGKGGERRLNVAITRAREHMTIVSSFGAEDMDPERCTSEGTRLLRLLLQYAAGGCQSLGDGAKVSVPLNPFEADIQDALKARGIPLIAQWGVSRYRIDFAAAHPSEPGRFVLAIECDGASYHSAPTARDRDRLRQQHLEALGWRFHRIWSSDWFHRREDEIARALDAYQEAVARADRAKAEAAARPPLPVPAPPPPPRPSEAERDPSSAPLFAQLPRRGPRPNVRERDAIADYSDRELDEVVRWIVSDGRLRPQDALVREVATELGFKRLGSRIAEAIEAAIGRVRGSGGTESRRTA